MFVNFIEFNVFLTFCSYFSSLLGSDFVGGNLTSYKSQMPSSTLGNLVKFEDVSSATGLSFNDERNVVIFKEDGIYLIISSGQVGSNSRGSSGWLDLWHILNDISVQGSNNRTSISNSLDVALMSTQSILNVKAGDRLSFGFSASGPTIGFMTYKPDREPVVSSINISIAKLK